MNVFTDFHHTALLRSIIMLFEDRLGGNVYRPIGTEWHEKGFWKVYDHPATVQQFLTLAQGYRPVDGTPPLNVFTYPEYTEPDVYYCADPENDTYNKAITFEKFLAMDIDIIIASMPEHIEPFKKLIREYKPNAKLILQVGNNWNWESMGVQNVMASTAPKPVPQGVNAVFYHQEFSLDRFHTEWSYPRSRIYSFVNIIQNTQDYELYLGYKRSLPHFDFKAYGAQCPDGVVNGTKELARKMREARFIWHVKPGGDGFGHVIHNAFAVGRPVITRKSHYAGCLAESLMVDGKTVIDLDAHNIRENLELIEHFSKQENWSEMAENVYNTFKEVVNYDAEEATIRKFLENLI